MAKTNSRWKKSCGSRFFQESGNSAIGDGGGNASTPICSVTEQGQSFVLNHNESGKVQINSSHSIEMSAGIAHGHEGVDIKIESQKGDLQLFAANGKVWIKGDDINITSGGDLTMHAANDMKITSDNRMEIYAPIMDIDGHTGTGVPFEVKWMARVFEKSFVGTDKVRAATTVVKSVAKFSLGI